MKISIKTKICFYFSGYPLHSKFFDPVDKKAIGKMKDEFKGKLISGFIGLKHSHKKRIVWKHGAEPAVLRTYVENQAILEPILLYRGSKCKQTKEQDSENCL